MPRGIYNRDKVRIENQKKAHTFNRNKYIKFLYFKCGWKQTTIAKMFGVSRQCINVIVHRNQTHQKTRMVVFLRGIGQWIIKRIFQVRESH